jgi:hypothetical protein
MKYLFIGGSVDGERRTLENENIPYRIAVPKPFNEFQLRNPVLMTEKRFDEEIYLPRRLADLDGARYVVFQQNDDKLCPIARLIDGYKKAE